MNIEVQTSNSRGLSIIIWARILLHTCLVLIIALLASEGIYAQQGTLTDDAHTSSASPNSNFSTAISLKVTTTPVQNSYLKFKLTPSLPPGTTANNVAKATLKLFVNSIGGVGTIDVYRVTSSWDEGSLKYNNSPTLGTIEQGGVVVSAGLQFLTIDLTQLVKDWLNGPSNGGIANNGIALVGNSSGAVVSIDSKEGTVTSHEPRLEITLVNSGPPGPQGPPGTFSGDYSGTANFSGRLNLTSGVFSVPNGTTAQPSITFSDPSTGWIQDAPGSITFVSSNSPQIRFYKDNESSVIHGLGTNRLGILSNSSIVFGNYTGHYEIEGPGDRPLGIVGYALGTAQGKTVIFSVEPTPGLSVTPLAAQGDPRNEVDIQTWIDWRHKILARVTPYGGGVFANLATAITTKSGDYTITDSDSVILANSPTSITLTLPSAVGKAGRQYIIKNIGTGAVTIVPSGTQKIDGSPSQTISTQYLKFTLVSDGANWYIL